MLKPPLHPLVETLLPRQNFSLSVLSDSVMLSPLHKQPFFSVSSSTGHRLEQQFVCSIIVSTADVSTKLSVAQLHPSLSSAC